MPKAAPKPKSKTTKPRPKPNGKKLGLRLYWRSHFDPDKITYSTLWFRTEADRDKAVTEALANKVDGKPLYTDMKKVERA